MSEKKSKEPEKKKTRYSRSARLRKYGSVYKNLQSGIKPVSDSTEKKKKSLNSYQKFVQEETKKSKYKNMRGSERLSAIASAWEKKKRKDKKK